MNMDKSLKRVIVGIIVIDSLKTIIHMSLVSLAYIPLNIMDEVVDVVSLALRDYKTTIVFNSLAVLL